jgi:methylenetetrahydrofolate dehydrogenase (NADP+)/methenyltetrahydrofolate cyclohydrolase
MTRQADILIVAAGHPGLITPDMVKTGAAVIDVAMNRDPATGAFTGDVCFDSVKEKASYITPVPGGVGPMTRAMLMRNVLTLAKLHMGLAGTGDIL